MNTVPIPGRSPWFTPHDLPCIPSPNTRRALPSLLRCPPSVTDSRSLPRSGLRLESAGSSLRTAESCSLSYGLHVRLRLLPTPPHGDAVTFGYRERASPGGGLSPPDRACSQAHGIPAFAGMTKKSTFLFFRDHQPCLDVAPELLRSCA